MVGDEGCQAGVHLQEALQHSQLVHLVLLLGGEDHLDLIAVVQGVDDVVGDPLGVEGTRHPHRQGHGARLGLRITNHEGSQGFLGQHCHG